jgi:hypothetical protein
MWPLSSIKIQTISPAGTTVLLSSSMDCNHIPTNFPKADLYI